MKHMAVTTTRTMHAPGRRKACHEWTDAAHLRHKTMTSISAPQHCSRRQLVSHVDGPGHRAQQTMSTRRRSMLARSHMLGINLPGARGAQWPPPDAAHEQQDQVGSLAAASEGAESHMLTHLRWTISASTQRLRAPKAALESSHRARCASAAPRTRICSRAPSARLESAPGKSRGLGLLPNTLICIDHSSSHRQCQNRSVDRHGNALCATADKPALRELGRHLWNRWSTST